MRAVIVLEIPDPDLTFVCSNMKHPTSAHPRRSTCSLVEIATDLNDYANAVLARVQDLAGALNGGAPITPESVIVVILDDDRSASVRFVR